MGYITSNQGRPIQGVSQQPDKTRLPGQCTASDNFRPDVVRGLTTRQGTKISAKLTDASIDTRTKWHHYERGTGEEYFISVELSGKVRAWSPDGTEHIINVQDNAEAGYLAATNARDSIKSLTIGDYTFFVNNTKNVLASSITTPANPERVIFYVQFMDYSQRIKLFINGTMAAVYSSPAGANPGDDKLRVSPEFIIESFLTVLTGGAGVGNPPDVLAGTAYGFYATADYSVDYNLVKNGSTILISRKDTGAFTADCTDGAANKNAVVIKDKLNDTTLLPPRAPDGFLIKIEPPGANKKNDASYYLVADNSDGDHITWRESIAPGISVGSDKTTMPHVLVRESIDGGGVATFTLRQGEWENRDVGDEDSNPQPTFVNTENPTPLQSIGLFQNRLFVTSGESVIMTRSDDFFDFYRETAQVALDTDPIDIYADVPQINFLEASAAFDGDLVFFSKNGQFILSGTEPVTPSNATLRQATSFETQLTVDPVASGDNVFFAFRYGRFTGVREFFTDSITDTKRARPVTDHVKEYISGDPSIMKSSTNLNLLVVKTDTDDNILYTYDWLWQGAEKVQSAWGRIVFPEDTRVLHYEFVDEILWLIMVRDNLGEAGSVYIEKVDMGDPDDECLTFPVRADRKTTGQMTKLPDGRYMIDDPLPNVNIDDIIVIRCTGAYEEDIGTPVDVYKVDGGLYTDEELDDGPVTVIIGRKYECSYTPTNPVAKDENDQALNLDRLTVGAFYLNYNTTGDMIAEVQGKYGDPKIYEYGNRTLGGPENLVGFSPLVSGQHRVPIRQKSDRYTLTFKTDSHIPLEIRDFEFNGNLNRRGRRI